MASELSRTINSCSRHHCSTTRALCNTWTCSWVCRCSRTTRRYACRWRRATSTLKNSLGYGTNGSHCRSRSAICRATHSSPSPLGTSSRLRAVMCPCVVRAYLFSTNTGKQNILFGLNCQDYMNARQNKRLIFILDWEFVKFKQIDNLFNF